MLFNKNKKGQMQLAGKIWLIIIMAIVLIMLILGFFLYQLVGPPLVSTLQDASGTISGTMQQSGDQNLQNASAASFEPALQSTNNMEWLGYTLFIVMFFTWIIMCFYVRSHPYLMLIWIVLVIIMVVLSIYLAVVYQDLRTSPGLADYYQSWENTDFMLKNLPIIVTILGIGGGIVMFILASREPEAEGNYGGYYPI